MSKSTSEPIRGPHHCIGTANTIVDLVFDHLHKKCTVAGGSLAEADLSSAKTDLLNGLFKSPDFFEHINRQCMVASGANAEKPFALGRLLSTALAFATEKSAERAFSLQMSFLPDAWAEVFYEGLSVFVQTHLRRGAETDLVKAYTKAAGKFRQKLTVEQFVSEENVQSVLDDCLLALKEQISDDESAARLAHELNDYIEVNAWRAGSHLDQITSEQMKVFVDDPANNAAH